MCHQLLWFYDLCMNKGNPSIVCKMHACLFKFARTGKDTTIHHSATYHRLAMIHHSHPYISTNTNESLCAVPFHSLHPLLGQCHLSKQLHWQSLLCWWWRGTPDVARLWSLAHFPHESVLCVVNADKSLHITTRDTALTEITSLRYSLSPNLTHGWGRQHHTANG